MPKGDDWTCRHCRTVNFSRSGYVAQWCRECWRPWPKAALRAKGSE